MTLWPLDARSNLNQAKILSDNLDPDLNYRKGSLADFCSTCASVRFVKPFKNGGFWNAVKGSFEF